ncbi:voltage-dependent calcium channel subunit alpha-2/delta-4 isoform X4 [Hydra vulgaris]|uniref:Voltage-dependent calcium channel subunit alpha-2/delta-4 isoform X4 n=2 Tax=Hydra vulgaris TaxID=6087 RepID=A0ABM4BQZ6_HYDVU
MRFKIIFILLFGVVKNDLPTVATLKEGAAIFSRILDYYTNKITQYKALSEDFNSIKNSIQFLKTDGQKINDQFNHGVASLFEKKVKSLESIKKKILDEKESYKYVDNLERFEYPNVRDIFAEYSRESNTSIPVIEIVGPFPTDVPINLTRSFVHIPTNIYAYSSDMLNKVLWTQKLDDVFISNQRNDVHLIMEEYCEPSGFLRMFPGNLNGYSNAGPDLYDCRNRVWFQMSSTSPKDVVIVIDTSGSMAGTNIIIAGITAKALIDTLTENDYFNVLTVAKSTTYVSPCIKFLIQATKFNKERMKYDINKIAEPSGQLNLSDGISSAFKTLNSDTNFNRTYTSGCNKLIMVISEGIEGDYKSAAKDIFDKMNKDKKVRVFSYRVGRVKNPNNQALKEMSCNNRGYFYQIETLNNIWDTVPKYLNVLSRSIANSRAEVKPKISPLYLDSTGAGMVLTISLGIFDNGNYSGVVGIDMLSRAVKQLVQSNSLGYFSHTLVINNNGFIVSHPKFKEQGGYLTPPGNIYFEDLEYSQNINDSITLKSRMINGENGSVNLMTYWLYDNNRKLAENNMTYYFNPVNDTLLFSSFALSDVDRTFFQLDRNVSNSMYEYGLVALYIYESENFTENATTPAQPTYVDIPNWQYCNITSSDINKTTNDMKVYPKTKEVYEFLLNYGSIDDITDDCDEILVSSLLVTAGYAFLRINQSWASFLDEKQIEDPDFQSVYVGTAGGYTRYFGLNITQIPPRDTLRTELFEQALAMPLFNILVSVPIRDVFDDEVVFLKVKASSWVERDGNKILLAVTGTEMNSGLMKEIFDNMTLSIGLKDDCKNNNTFVCAVVDQNGYIVVSNQGGELIGRFLGEIQGQLMEHFSSPDISIFKKVTLKDSQAVCLEEKSYNSNADHLMNPAILLFKLCSWLLCSMLSLMYHFIMLAYSVIQIPLGGSLNPDNYINITCVKKLSFYLFQSNKWDDLLNREELGKKSKRSQFTLRVVQCTKSKSQQYVLAPIPNTNLIFIVANQPDERSCRKNISLVEDIDQIDDFCTQEEPYRVMPGKCYSETSPDDELPQYCGVARNLRASITVFFTIFLFGLIIKLKVIDYALIN